MENNKREFKGIWIPREVYLSDKVCWTAKIIFLEIDSFTSKGLDCFFSNEYLAAFVGVSVSQVSRHLTKLTEIGWIKQTKFDGRKRFLQSSLALGFKADYASSTRQTPHEVQGSLDPNAYHNNTVNNPLNKTFNIPSANAFPGEENPIELSVISIPPPGSAPPPKPKKTDTLFRESQFFDKVLFRSMFDGTDYELADLDYYHEVILNWSDGKGMKRKDWIATAKNWILKDKQDKKLRLRHGTTTSQNSKCDGDEAERLAVLIATS